MRSSKAHLDTCSIHHNGPTSSSTTLEGGGIMVHSSAEDVNGVVSDVQFDVILRVIWDHIDQVLLEARRLELRDNEAPTRDDLYIVRNLSGYNHHYRDTLESRDLVHSLPIHVSLECTNPIRDVIDAEILLINRDGSPVNVAPDFISANSLENTV